MKKILAFILALVLVLSLAACGNNGQTGGTTTAPTTGNNDDKEAGPLQVGFGRGDITPTFSVGLDGYGAVGSHMSTRVLDNLYATCTAFSNGKTTLLMFSIDNLRSLDKWTQAAREKITAETGVPGENIMLVATHTHSAPALDTTLWASDEGDPEDTRYWKIYMDGVVKAAKDAMADLTPATMYGGSTQVEGMNFTRHYLINNGTYAGPNFGDFRFGIKDYASPGDHEMQLVKIVREGDKRPILLMNWAGHPCQTGGSAKYDVSADYVGTCRAKIERETDMLFMFLLNGSGVMNVFSEWDKDKHNLDNTQYGERLAEIALENLSGLKKLEGNLIETQKVAYVGNVNHEDEDKLEAAKQVKAHWDATGSRDQGNALAVELGLSSVYHANAIIARVNRPQTITFDLFVNRVGNLSFANMPFEMFAAQNIQIKNDSPFEMTFINSCANDYQGYLPTQFAVGYGCYESYTTFFEYGMAEKIGEQMATMLKDLYTEENGTTQEVQGGIKSELTNDSTGSWTDATSLPAQGTWKLDTDVTLNESVFVNTGFELTIDLNGHKIIRKVATDQFHDQQAIRVIHGGKLTIKDSAGGGTMTAEYADGATFRTPGMLIHVEKDAEAVIENGIFDASAIKSNYTEYAGGLIAVYGKLTIKDGTFKGYSNTAAGKGTTLAAFAGSELTIEKGTFQGGTTAGDGGVIASAGALTINGGTFTAGGAVNGGLILVNGGGLTINGGTFTGANVTGEGAVVKATGSITITGGTFQAAKAVKGGIISTSAMLTINGGTFKGLAGSGTTHGGIIYSTGGTLTINAGELSGGDAASGYSIYYEKNNGNLVLGENAKIDGGIVIVCTNTKSMAKLRLAGKAIVDSSKAAVAEKYDLKLSNVRIFIDGTEMTEVASGKLAEYDVVYDAQGAVSTVKKA